FPTRRSSDLGGILSFYIVEFFTFQGLSQGGFPRLASSHQKYLLHSVTCASQLLWISQVWKPSTSRKKRSTSSTAVSTSASPPVIIRDPQKRTINPISTWALFTAVSAS